jgi:hypothetical protein
MNATADALRGLLASIKYGATAVAMMQRPMWRCSFCRAVLDNALDAENSAAHDDECPVRVAIDALKTPEPATATLVAFSTMASDPVSKMYGVPYDAVMDALKGAGWRVVGRYERGTVVRRGDSYWHISSVNDGVLIIVGQVLPVKAGEYELDF